MPNNNDIQDDSPFQLHARPDILALLKRMQEHKQLLSLHLTDGATSLITTILDIDVADDSVVIDAAPSAALNERILQSQHIDFEARHNHIHISFHADKAHPYRHQEKTALKITIPKSLVRLQRREYFRVATSIAKPFHVIFNTPKQDRIVTLLNNISTSGVGISVEKKLFHPPLDHIYRDCLLVRDGNTVITVNLQVRDGREVKLRSGKIMLHIGCAFVDLPHAMLNTIQRFITKLEREQNAKLAGLM